MNIHALRIFNIVAKRLSVTRASEELCISQPAVTAQIKNLEKELGNVKLIHSTKGKGIELTDLGELLARQAERLFYLESEIEEVIANYQKSNSERLKIVATYLPANLLLPEWVAKYKQINEQVEIVINTSNSKGAFDQLLHYQADLAIYGGLAENHPSIDWDELFKDELWFIVPPNHRLANKNVCLAEMMKEPFILREEGSSTRDRLISLCKAYNVQPPVISLQFNGLSETIHAVMAGYGANFVSALAVHKYVQHGVVARVYVSDVDLKNTIAICTRKNDRLSEQARDFISLIKQNYIFSKQLL
ncbi:LysR family transcriptional regulator [Gorillibacterium massiliense]|uniref:LysR family transcriptional regulator n=1 Tax=Gorillibacterium massiliense TaxID=1280390 RepID=UPI0004AC8723|nr:LysR family transcriptional regulator [Gorillibacterium massiliense]